MNGISCLLSKSFSPLYNPITSNNANIIPCRSPNLHLKSQSISPLVANKRVPKHLIYSSSSSKDVMGSTSVGSTSINTVGATSIFLGFLVLALQKAWEIVAPSISSTKGYMKLNGVLVGFATGLVARGILERIVYPFSQPPLRIGDMIQVGSVEGRVIEKRPTLTELAGAENRRITLPNSLFSSENIVNRTPAGWYDIMSFNVHIAIEEFDKIKDIANEIVEMMKSNPYVLLDVQQPSWYSIGDSEFCFYCHLKQMSPDIYFTAREDIEQQAVELISIRSTSGS